MPSLASRARRLDRWRLVRAHARRRRLADHRFGSGLILCLAELFAAELSAEMRNQQVSIDILAPRIHFMMAKTMRLAFPPVCPSIPRRHFPSCRRGWRPRALFRRPDWLYRVLQLARARLPPYTAWCLQEAAISPGRRRMLRRDRRAFRLADFGGSARMASKFDGQVDQHAFRSAQFDAASLASKGLFDII